MDYFREKFVKPQLVQALKALCEALVDQGIMPYYLNQLDGVQGAAHFEVSEEQGLALIAQLRTEVSGYAVPRYVKEVPHALSKTPIKPL
jgi:L-lysine 2,3-aminomutase